MNEATVLRDEHKSKQETRSKTGHGKVLKRQDLLNYFKKLEKAFEWETSSENEGYKSSTTDIESLTRSKSNRKGRSKKILSTELPLYQSRRTSKTKPCKETRDICKSSQNHTKNNKKIYNSPRTDSNILQHYEDHSRSNDRLSKASRKNSALEYFQERRKTDQRQSSDRPTNSRITENSLSEGNVGKFSNNDLNRRTSTRRGTSAPLFPVATGNDACRWTESKYKQALKDIHEQSGEVSRLFPIKDDLNSSEILCCEELLRKELQLPKCCSNRKEKSAEKYPLNTSLKSSKIILQSSKCKKIDHRAAEKTEVFRETKVSVSGKDNRSRLKNRENIVRNKERVNTLAQKGPVVNANGSQYRDEAEGKGLRKVINQRRDTAQFAIFSESDTETEDTAVDVTSYKNSFPKKAQAFNKELEQNQRCGYEECRRRKGVGKENTLKREAAGSSGIDCRKLHMPESSLNKCSNSFKPSNKIIQDCNWEKGEGQFAAVQRRKLQKSRPQGKLTSNEPIRSCPCKKSGSSIADTLSKFKLPKYRHNYERRRLFREIDSRYGAEATRKMIANQDQLPARSESYATCCCSTTLAAYNPGKHGAGKSGSTNSIRIRADRSSPNLFYRQIDSKVCRRCCCDDLSSPDRVENLKRYPRKPEVPRLLPSDRPFKATNVKVDKPKESFGKVNLKKVLIYPPPGETGPPLTLYKNASNISCTVIGNTRTGFRYDVTYVQKFASSTWCPDEDVGEQCHQTMDKCDCFSDYG